MKAYIVSWKYVPETKVVVWDFGPKTAVMTATDEMRKRWFDPKRSAVTASAKRAPEYDSLYQGHQAIALESLDGTMNTP